MDDLERILHYKMNEMEAKAYKILLIWRACVKKEFPNYRINKINGDPRKSVVFKYCHTLLRQTKGLIPDKEYVLYITAQLQILRAISGGDVRIDPNILVGPKAWKRWKFWKYRYDKKKIRQQSVSEVKITAPTAATLSDLKATKAFLEKHFGHQPTKEELKTVDKNQWMLWKSHGKVSGYYLVLSPIVGPLLEGIDLSLFQQSITESIQNSFKILFDYEF